MTYIQGSQPTPAPSPQNDPADDINQELQKDYDTWQADQEQLKEDLQQVLAMLDKMQKAEHGGKFDSVSIALSMAFTCVLPTIFSEKEDNLNQLSDSQNIASDLRRYVTLIQNDFNSIGNGASAPTGSAGVNKMNQEIQSLENWTSKLSQDGGPLDPTSAGQLTTALTDITTQLSGKTDTDVWNWFNPPTPDPSKPPQPSTTQFLKAIQGDIQQSNSSVSTLSTTTQTTEQFYVNQYNQITGIDNSIQQSWVSGQGVMVNNEKSN
jgi:hypothetical protein